MERAILGIIEENYEVSTKTQKRLADFIRDNIHMISFLSIAELGEKTKVGLDSVTRFKFLHDSYCPERKKNL